MARETITKLVDDLDGGAASETVTFGLDGQFFEIDLSAKNAKKLRSELAIFIEHGNRVNARAGGRGAGRRAAAGSTEQNRAIRQWAQAKGYDVAGRGRLRQDIVDAFHQKAGR